MSKLVVKHFSQIQVSNLGHVNNENVEEYVTKLLEQTQAQLVMEGLELWQKNSEFFVQKSVIS